MTTTMMVTGNGDNDGDGMTGDKVEDDGDGTMGNDDEDNNDGNVTGDGATGYNNDDYG